MLLRKILNQNTPRKYSTVTTDRKCPNHLEMLLVRSNRREKGGVNVSMYRYWVESEQLVWTLECVQPQGGREQPKRWLIAYVQQIHEYDTHILTGKTQKDGYDR